MIHSNYSLKSFNTFGINVDCKFFAEAKNEDAVRLILEEKDFKTNDHLILGGGSNLLFTKDFDGFVLKNNIHGVELISETDDHVFVRVGAGEVWHNFVLAAIKNNWFGIENLSLIPGSVGASPMQNIGAYGVEIKEVFYELEAIHIPTGEIHYFESSDCDFGYRESVFKNKHKGEYVISRVTYKLNKTPKFNVGYGAVESELEKMQVKELSAKAVSDAIVAIRSSKLPNPAEIGNSGSFFKNPVVSNSVFEAIKTKYPNAVGYPVGEEATKLAAGWLIDQAGWKGYTEGNFGVHKNQALVLVNYGGAAGADIYNLSERILQSVFEKFGVQLEREVNIY